VIELVEEVNKRSNRKQISTIDIGKCFTLQDEE